MKNDMILYSSRLIKLMELGAPVCIIDEERKRFDKKLSEFNSNIDKYRQRDLEWKGDRDKLGRFITK